MRREDQRGAGRRTTLHTPHLVPLVVLTTGLLMTSASPGRAEPADTAAPPDATLTLTITHVANADGTIYVAVYDDPATFLDTEQKRVGAKTPAQAGAVEITIPDLPPGRYAVAMYHDEDDNGAFDTGLFGIPLEGFGFTRDPSVIPERPSFDDAAITVTAPETLATLRMRYSL
ncbi:DUF2141 domain-containing protein [Roseospira marina]|nr:DUF2141 domain-containing protein [Roseospira marina]MBB4313706.1 uncharacterized protein (DUF2141 family) [Roseospira marina]MBB5086868.1 uncharacterized protein (DUF2141 family) [Roseospira marina]